MNGFLNILKPPGLTSHDVVKYVRRLFPGTKVGHGGTLDPGAAGVLPLLLGQATRFSSYLMDLPKVYRAELFLGLTTDTDDSSGKTVDWEEGPISLQKGEIKKILTSFLGEIEQVPPMFAAIKKKGKKLYEYAREGIVVQRPARKVQIHSLQMLAYYPPTRILLEIGCSKGTYIRTLCAQIGAALGYGGHMSFLLRKEVGTFELAQACTLDDPVFSSGVARARQALLPLDYPFLDRERLCPGEKGIKKLLQGQYIPFKELQAQTGGASGEPVDGKILPVYTTTGEFAGLAGWKLDRAVGFQLKPEKMIQI
ncbi:MAG: tRNA pseudouridine(55) synthase TruB [Firmicutes bacterium]|nr:tRNA pseudouridine(55) synthase TruB [Bacillota bacterium]